MGEVNIIASDYTTLYSIQFNIEIFTKEIDLTIRTVWKMKEQAHVREGSNSMLYHGAAAGVS